MAKKEKTVFTANGGGWGIDTKKLKGASLTDDQARTLAIQLLAEAIGDFSASVNDLAKAMRGRPGSL